MSGLSWSSRSLIVTFRTCRYCLVACLFWSAWWSWSCSSRSLTSFTCPSLPCKAQVGNVEWLNLSQPIVLIVLSNTYIAIIVIIDHLHRHGWLSLLWASNHDHDHQTKHKSDFHWLITNWIHSEMYHFGKSASWLVIWMTLKTISKTFLWLVGRS